MRRAAISMVVLAIAAASGCKCCWRPAYTNPYATPAYSQAPAYTPPPPVISTPAPTAYTAPAPIQSQPVVQQMPVVQGCQPCCQPCVPCVPCY